MAQQRRPPPESRAPGALYRTDYVPKDRETEALYLDGSGLPSAYLWPFHGRLVLMPDDSSGILNPRSHHPRSLGLFSVIPRPGRYYEEERLRADLSPGSQVEVVRERDHPHDGNALVSTNSGDLIGYVPRGYARRLARQYDDGVKLRAVATRGQPPGEDGAVLVLVGELLALRHLVRHLPNAPALTRSYIPA